MTHDRSPFRILHVVDDFSSRNTGVTATLRHIVGWQASRCEWVGVHTVGTVDMPTPSGVDLRISPLHQTWPFWRYPEGGTAPILDLIKRHRVTHIHVHELWRAAFVVGMRAAKRADLPVVMSIHDQSSPAAVNHKGPLNRLKKRLYWSCFSRHILAPRTAIHAITPLEAKHIHNFLGLTADAVIPNAIDLNNPLFQASQTAPKHRIVFLGRLNPVKGVDILIEAFDRADLGPEWELLIAGPEEVPEYVQELRRRAEASRKAARISFVGVVRDEAKRALLASAWVVAVPSHSEAIGMVNLEAASLNTPTITTPATGLATWPTGGGVLVAPERDALVRALEGAVAWPLDERVLRGHSARALVEAEYSLDVAGSAWLRFYKRIAKTTS